MKKVRQPRTHEEEMARVCDFEGCNVSLAYGQVNQRWCAEHSDAGRRLNNKRRREQAKVLIKPENYREDLPPSIALTESLAILYEDYKEPLRRVNDVKGEGYGYMGTIAMSEDREHLQCHICGDLFTSLRNHIRYEHQIGILEYKKEFGLSVSTALIGESTRYLLQQRNLNSGRNKGQPKHLQEYAARQRAGEKRKIERGDYSLEWRNKKGLCPDQVLEKIVDLKDKLGHVPSYEEFYEHYEGRYIHSIKYLHGSWTEAVRKTIGKTREDLRRHSEEDLIAELQNFQKRYGRIPMTSDFNRGLLTNKGTFIRKFGTLNKARIAAGMNAIVPVGGRYGNYKEITPEEYAKYEAGQLRSKDAIRAKKYREAKKLKKMGV